MTKGIGLQNYLFFVILSILYVNLSYSLTNGIFWAVTGHFYLVFWRFIDIMSENIRFTGTGITVASFIQYVK